MQPMGISKPEMMKNIFCHYAREKLMMIKLTSRVWSQSNITRVVAGSGGQGASALDFH